MKIGFHTLLGWVILILQSTVVRYISADAPQPDLLFLILVWVGFTTPSSVGLPTALIFGVMQDLFVGGVPGTHVFQFVTLYFMMRLMGGRLLLSLKLVQAGVVLVFTVMGDVLLILCARWVALPPVAIGPPDLGTPGRVAVNVITALFLFPLLQMMERRLWPRMGRLPLDVK